MAEEKENGRIEFLIEKNFKKDPESPLTTTDRIMEGLKLFQSLYPYLLHIVGEDDFIKWHEQETSIPYFTNCKQTLSHGFENPFAFTRCSATRLVINFFIFPHYSVEDILNTTQEILSRKRSFSDLSSLASLSSQEYSDNLVITRYDMGGRFSPDHTFITIKLDNYLIIVQSFYYVYNVNSKYGIVILSGDKIQDFERLMDEYDIIEKEFAAESIQYNYEYTMDGDHSKLIDNLIQSSSKFTSKIYKLNEQFSQYTGVDMLKHCYYISSQTYTYNPAYITKNIYVYPKRDFIENICQKFSDVLKFITSTIDFENFDEEKDILMVRHPKYSAISASYNEIFNAFVDNINYEKDDPDFIKYTGFDSLLEIIQHSPKPDFGTCQQFNNYYSMLRNPIININILFTGINYMFDLFNCTDIMINKYGDILEKYTGNTHSKEFYKKILKTSKIIRDIFEKNKDKSIEEIAEITEKEIKLKPYIKTQITF
jgi:hypothetical protein